MKRRLAENVFTLIVSAALASCAGCAAASLLGFTGAAGEICAFSFGLIFLLSAASLFKHGTWLFVSICAFSFGLWAAVDRARKIKLLISCVRACIDENDISLLMPSKTLVLIIVSMVFSIIIYVLLHDGSGFAAAFAGVFVLLTVLFSGVGEDDPVLIICALVFSLAAVMRASVKTGLLKRMMLVLPIVFIVLAAFIIAPESGTVYAPVSRISYKIKQVCQRYLSFTDERIAFSIAEKGYDSYTMYNDAPTHLLGGPAEPNQEPVFRCVSDSDILLRGSIKTVYTGNTWTDEGARERGLFYNIAGRSWREKVFLTGYDFSSKAYSKANAQIEFLNDGTSTIFVPAMLTDLDYDLSDALYFNSEGEVFLTHGVEEGSKYSLNAYVINDLTQISEKEQDKHYKKACASYLLLPDCVPDELKELTDEIVKDNGTDIEKAMAIREYLIKNCAYKTDVWYPDYDRDFVSQFVFETKEGYCTYFASALTVMCRLAGIPARYCEGYHVPTGESVITGEDAHAWTEVFIKGAGFVPIDATPQTRSSDNDFPEFDEIEDEPIYDDTGEPDDTNDGQTEEENDGTDDMSTPDDQDDFSTEDEIDLGYIKKMLAVFIVLIIIVIAIVLRFIYTEPLRAAMCIKDMKSRAYMLLYTTEALYKLSGCGIRGGESLNGYAERLKVIGIKCDALKELAQDMTCLIYSKNGDADVCAEKGAKAYIEARTNSKRSTRVRFRTERALSFRRK